jgi:hypothetical protein
MHRYACARRTLKVPGTDTQTALRLEQIWSHAGLGHMQGWVTCNAGSHAVMQGLVACRAGSHAGLGHMQGRITCRAGSHAGLGAQGCASAQAMWCRSSTAPADLCALLPTCRALDRTNLDGTLPKEWGAMTALSTL